MFLPSPSPIPTLTPSTPQLNIIVLGPRLCNYVQLYITITSQIHIRFCLSIHHHDLTSTAPPAASVQFRPLFVPVIVFLLNPFQTCSLEASRPCPRLTDTPRLPPMVNMSPLWLWQQDKHSTYFLHHIMHAASNVSTVKARSKTKCTLRDIKFCWTLTIWNIRLKTRVTIEFVYMIYHICVVHYCTIITIDVNIGFELSSYFSIQSSPHPIILL